MTIQYDDIYVRPKANI